MKKKPGHEAKQDIKNSIKKGNKYGYLVLAKIYLDDEKEPQKAIELLEKGIKEYPRFVLLNKLLMEVIGNYGKDYR